jgi:hypothetical protein
MAPFGLVFDGTARMHPNWEETKLQVQQNKTSSWSSADAHLSDKNKDVLPRGRPDGAQFHFPWVGNSGGRLRLSRVFSEPFPQGLKLAFFLLHLRHD